MTEALKETLGKVANARYERPMRALTALQHDLDQLDAAGRRRTLSPARGLDFASNDYLGLAASPRLRAAITAALDRGVAVGAGGSRLLRGNADEHAALEQDAARFFGAESALFMASGHVANSVLFATLPQRDDLVVHDDLIHASTREGLRLGRAEVAGFAHNQVDAASDGIAAWRNAGGVGTPWIAIESLYSMDGDRAPLDDFVALAEREEAMLVVDEAHATGVYGRDGRGLAAALDGRENVVIVRTCGKALGCEGALVLGPDLIRDFLINRGRGFIFSTAPSPLMAAAVREALDMLRTEPERRDRLAELIRHLGEELRMLGLPASGSAIQPIIIGDDRRAMTIAAELQARGFDVRGIRPPTVPPGTARLRISITLNVDEDALSALATALGELL